MLIALNTISLLVEICPRDAASISISADSERNPAVAYSIYKHLENLNLNNHRNFMLVTLEHDRKLFIQVWKIKITVLRVT